MFVFILLIALLGPSSELPLDTAARPVGVAAPSSAWLDTSPLVGPLTERIRCLRGDASPVVRRARRSTWWPDVTVRGDWDRGYDVQRDAVFDADFTPTGDLDGADARDLSRWGDGRAWSVGVQLSWDLGEARYHPDEDVWSREAARWADTATRRVDEALDAWRVRAAARRRMVAEDDPSDRAMAAAEITAIDAWLDTLSEGWWSVAVDALSAGAPAPRSCPGAR